MPQSARAGRSTRSRRTSWCATAPVAQCAWPATIRRARQWRAEPGEPAGRMGDGRFTPPRRANVSGQAQMGELRHGRGQCLHLVPRSAQCRGRRRLLRGTNEAACVCCHGGGTNLSPAAPNVVAEYSKISHPFPNGTISTMQRKPRCSTTIVTPPASIATTPRAQQVTSFNIPPLVRASQTGREAWPPRTGPRRQSRSVNQYENCLRCHGYSAGKPINRIYGYLPLRAASDPLNVILADEHEREVQPSGDASAQQQLAPAQSAADHARLQPAAPTMAATMDQQIFCTDCHNADDNREFGGAGPNGPHGSKWWHILEHDYEDSQAPGGPGTLITINLNPQPDLSVNGPYGMCAKCHDLSIVMQSVSWSLSQRSRVHRRLLLLHLPQRARHDVPPARIPPECAWWTSI